MSVTRLFRFNNEKIRLCASTCRVHRKRTVEITRITPDESSRFVFNVVKFFYGHRTRRKIHGYCRLFCSINTCYISITSDARALRMRRICKSSTVFAWSVASRTTGRLLNLLRLTTTAVRHEPLSLALSEAVHFNGKQQTSVIRIRVILIS